MRWRPPFRVLVMVLAVTALYAIIPWGWNASIRIAQDAVAALTAWRDSRPARTLALRRGDRERFPRRGFGLVLESDRGFGVDTFAGKATKDMIGLPDTTIDLNLSDAQLDTLYEAVIRMRFFDYPEQYPPGFARGYTTAGSKLHLIVRAGDATKDLTWDQHQLPREPVSDEWKRLRGMVLMLTRMVLEHAAYRALPPPSGIYFD